MAKKQAKRTTKRAKPAKRKNSRNELTHRNLWAAQRRMKALEDHVKLVNANVCSIMDRCTALELATVVDSNLSARLDALERDAIRKVR